jgi:hypothetical protein
MEYLRQAALMSKNMPNCLRDAILGADSDGKILEYMDASRERRAMVRTSTAVDLVSGGDKGMNRPPLREIAIDYIKSEFPSGKRQYHHQPPYSDPRFRASSERPLHPQTQTMGRQVEIRTLCF